MSRISILCLLLFPSMFACILLADEPVRVDRYGDPLPGHALARLGTVRFRHCGLLDCLAYSPDGKFIASGGDGNVNLWEPRSGRKLRELNGNRGWLHNLAISPCSKYVAAGCVFTTGKGGDLCVWEVATGRLLFKPVEMPDAPSLSVFSPDAKAIATGHSSNNIRVWDTQTGKLNRVLTCDIDPGGFSSLAFPPDGKTLVSVGYDGCILFWDLTTGKPIDRAGKPAGNFHSVAFSPDGSILAAAGPGGIRLFRASNLAEMRRLDLKGGKVHTVTFSQNGKTLFSDGDDHIPRAWDVSSGKQMVPETKRGCPCAFSPDGKWIATGPEFVGLGGAINLWNAQTGAALHPRECHQREVGKVAFLRDGKSVVTMAGLRLGIAEVAVWPQGTGKNFCPLELPPHSGLFFVCPDRSTLGVTTDDNTFLLPDLPSGREKLRRPIAGKKWVTAVLADNNRAVVDDHRGTISVLDLTRDKTLHQIGPGAFYRGLSPDGRLLAVQVNDELCLWDLDTKKEQWRCVNREGQFSQFTFSPDGRKIVLGSFKSSFQLLETATGKLCLELEDLEAYARGNPLRAMAISPNGRTLAISGHDCLVRLWDLSTGKEVKVFRGHQHDVNSLDFSPDGSRLVTASDDTTALIWEVPTSLRARERPVEALSGEESSKLWNKLADDDAALAYAAMQRLSAFPADAVSSCKEHLLGVSATSASPDQIHRWIRQLDDEEFSVREKASENLERVEGEAEKALEKALKGDCSPEVQRRINALLETLKGKQLTIRVLRAVELLEQVGTPEAVDVLRQLEKKTGDAAVRDDVRRSLGRLAAKQKAR